MQNRDRNRTSDAMICAEAGKKKHRGNKENDIQPSQDLQIPAFPPLPASMRNPSVEEPMRSDSETQKQKKRLMVVDDEFDYREIISAHLERDYDIYAVRNGTEALMLLEWMKEKRELPDAIVTDQMMPQVNGDEFIAEARRMASGLKFILITSNTSLSEDSLVKGGAPDKLMYKTCLPDPHVLREAVAELLRDKERTGDVDNISW